MDPSFGHPTIWFLASWWPNRVNPLNGNFIQGHAKAVGPYVRLAVGNVQADAQLPVGKISIAVSEAPEYTEHIVYYGKGEIGLINIVNRLKAYIKLIRLLHRRVGTPDLVHANVIYDSGIFAFALKVLRNYRYVLSEHSTRFVPPNRLSIGRRLIARLVCRGAEIVLPVSEYLQERMRDYVGDVVKFKVVSNVVDTEVFRYEAGRRKRDRRKLRVLHVSNFKDSQKNMVGMIRTFAMVAKDCPGQIQFVIAGDGDKKLVKAWIAAQNAPDFDVSVSGSHTDFEIAALMQAADVFVLFSNFETQGVVLLEALCTGLPCIAAHVGPIPEIIQSGVNGFLVEAGHQAKLQVALAKFVTEEQSFNNTDIAAAAATSYGIRNIGNDIFRVYKAYI